MSFPPSVPDLTTMMQSGSRSSSTILEGDVQTQSFTIVYNIYNAIAEKGEKNGKIKLQTERKNREKESKNGKRQPKNDNYS